jgi:Uma2 family endonuclease
MTIEEFLRLPEIDEAPAAEFVEGRFVRKGAFTPRGSRLDGCLCRRLNVFARAGQLGQAFLRLRFTFGESSIVPDVVFQREEAILADDRGQISDEVVWPPDLLVEILSPEHSPHFAAEKLGFAVQNGCPLGWLIDPYAKTITTFAPGEKPKALGPGAILDGGPALPGFRLPVEEVFGWLKRPRRRGPGA